MGDRYFLTVVCPKCNRREDEVYYAPTCGFTEYECPCGEVIDLEELSGISYEEASNREEIQELVDKVSSEQRKHPKKVVSLPRTF